ncbi:hypothetical protein BKA69DRAFT_1121656 [Paraphysoderma sedebokerense]|nr:hypothetical protein BKA69DRAFT_1121656 [Paraphysoderma sedebokerense]
MPRLVDQRSQSSTSSIGSYLSELHPGYDTTVFTNAPYLSSARTDSDLEMPSLRNLLLSATPENSNDSHEVSNYSYASTSTVSRVPTVVDNSQFASNNDVSQNTPLTGISVSRETPADDSEDLEWSGTDRSPPNIIRSLPLSPFRREMEHNSNIEPIRPLLVTNIAEPVLDAPVVRTFEMERQESETSDDGTISSLLNRLRSSEARISTLLRSASNSNYERNSNESLAENNANNGNQPSTEPSRELEVRGRSVFQRDFMQTWVNRYQERRRSNQNSLGVATRPSPFGLPAPTQETTDIFRRMADEFMQDYFFRRFEPNLGRTSRLDSYTQTRSNRNDDGLSDRMDDEEPDTYSHPTRNNADWMDFSSDDYPYTSSAEWLRSPNNRSPPSIPSSRHSVALSTEVVILTIPPSENSNGRPQVMSVVPVTGSVRNNSTPPSGSGSDSDRMSSWGSEGELGGYGRVEDMDNDISISERVSRLEGELSHLRALGDRNSQRSKIRGYCFGSGSYN